MIDLDDLLATKMRYQVALEISPADSQVYYNVETGVFGSSEEATTFVRKSDAARIRRGLVKRLVFPKHFTEIEKDESVLLVGVSEQ